MVIVRTSLSRTFLHDGQIGLSLIARSTLSSKMSCELRAVSYGQTETLVCTKLAACGPLLYTELREISVNRPGL